MIQAVSSANVSKVGPGPATQAQHYQQYRWLGNGMHRNVFHGGGGGGGIFHCPRLYVILCELWYMVYSMGS